jgi:acyl carrier protein
MCDQLKQFGLHAVPFSIGPSIEATRSSWQTLLDRHHPATIILLDSAKQWVVPQILSAESQAAWKDFRNQHLMTPFWMLQDWLIRGGLSSGDGSGLCLALVTEQGGDFGLASGTTDIIGGSWVGLAKAIRNEFPALRLKAVDVHPDELELDKVCLEIVSDDTETQVGLRNGRRVALRPAQQAISSVSSGQAATHRLPQPGDAWVVSGGARGVTAVVARAIAQRFGVELHLLGSTNPGQLDPKWLELDEEGLKGLRSSVMLDARGQGKDPLSTWKNVEKTMELERNMREFAKAGVTPTYHCCDISNWHDVDQVLRKVRNQSGPIRGILHGAGFEAACKFEKKKPEFVERTLATKVDGAAALMGLTAQDQVDYFIGFGSTSGWFGGLGQADYSLANAALGQQMLALRTQRPTCRATVFHWHAWGEVGMAARPESRFALEAFGLQFMPTAEGVSHVLGELEAGLPEAHVLITEAKFCVDAIDAGQVASTTGVVPAVSDKVADAEPLGVAADNQGSDIVSTGGAAREELKQFLVNFVVEQTGYPADIVEMDADMESDLGIDSIKKAQLFGEVGEQFKLSADPNLSLDDFPTLGDVLQYLVDHVGGGNDATDSSAKEPGTTPYGATQSTQQPSCKVQRSVQRSVQRPVLGSSHR